MGTCDEKVLIAAICQRLEGQPGDYPNRVEGDAGHILTACQHLVTIQNSKFRFSHLSVQEYLESHQTELISTCHYDVAKVCASVVFRYRTAEGAMDPWAYYCHRAMFPIPLLRTGWHSSMNEFWHFACDQWHVHFQRISSPSERKDVQTIVDDSFPSSFTTWLNVRVSALTKLKRSSITAPDHSLLTTFSFNHSREFQSFWGVPLGSKLWAKSLYFLPASKNELGFPVVVDTAFTCGILNKVQRLVKKDMTRGVSLSGYEDGHQDNQGLLHQLFRSMMELRFEWVERLMYGSTGSEILARQLLDLGDTTRGREEFLALCKAFIQWRQAMSGTEDRTIESFKKLFSLAPQQDQDVEQCYGELARLTLLCICLTKDKELGDFLFGRFPHVSTIQYKHLVPPVGFDLDSALSQAATKEDKRYISLLLSHGANTNAVTAYGTPLMAALSKGRIGNAEVLLQAGADMDGVNLHLTKGYGNITIMACSIQDPALFQLLRKHDAIDADSVARTGRCLTPLIAACFHGNIDRVDVLLSMGADINRKLRTGVYANALCAAVDGQSMRAIRQLSRRDLLYPREDALEMWRVNHLASAPDNLASISKKCQSLLSWLVVPILRYSHNEGLLDSDTGDIERLDKLLWDGNDDSGTEDAMTESESEDSEYSKTNQGDDGCDKCNEPKQQHEEERKHHRTDTDSEGEADRDPTILRTARRDDSDVTAPSDNEVLENIRDLIHWLHNHCVQEPRVTQSELAGAFGFPSSKHDDSMTAELVRNSLLKGFENVVHLSHQKRTLEEITKAWAWFLDLAEDSMELVKAFENAFDKGDSAELARLHTETERLANGGV